MAHAKINFIADSLNRPIQIDVIFPTDKMCFPLKKVPKREPMKTLYFLEGSTSNSHRVITHTMIEPIAEDANLCVVIVGGEDKWYGNSDTSGDYWMRMVGEDLVNFTRATFNLSDKREDTFVGGFSMGGFGALSVGFNYPEVFGGIFLNAPALTKSIMLQSSNEYGHDAWLKRHYETMFGFKDISEIEGSVYDYDANAERVASGDGPKPKILLVCGELDGLMGECTRLNDRLKALGYDITFETVHGSHNWCVELNEAFMKAAEWIPTDDFGDNFCQTKPESNYEWPDFFSWRCWYNADKDGKLEFREELQGKELGGYLLK